MSAALDSILVREPLGKPTHPDGGKGLPTSNRFKVSFYHPAYQDDAPFLTLPALDGPAGGIHYDTARIACGVIANNRWDGYFSRERVKTSAVVGILPDGIIPPGDYYFHLAEPAEGKSSAHAASRLDTDISVQAADHPILPYPVATRFCDWQFPHNNLPDQWANMTVLPPLPARSANSSTLVAQRDTTCRISNCGEACEVAHIIPKAEDVWFHSNRMSRYISRMSRSGESAIGDTTNLMLLRVDLHRLFDEPRFALVPKAGNIVCHFVEMSELVPLLHNVTLQPLNGVAIEYIFSRFAWSIFNYTGEFLTTTVDRMLFILDAGAIFPTIRKVPGDECRTLKSQTRSRSASPTKRARKRTPDSQAEEQEKDVAYSNDAEFLPSTKPARRSFSRAITTSPSARLSLSSADGPPSSPPLTLTSPPDSTFPHNAKPMPCTHDEVDAKDARLNALKLEYLARERGRSDPNGIFIKEMEWCEGAFGRILSPHEVRRFFEALGCEVMHDKEEEDGHANGEVS
jgi:HNH endonuclease